MLNRLREKIEPIMNLIGTNLANTGIAPNTWTIIGFLAALLSGIIYALNDYIQYSTLYGGIILIIAGFLDMIDGSVARASKQVSKKGMFLDSTLDRVAEVIIYGGILYSGINSMLVLAAITTSLLVSYSRARAESLGIELKGIGIGERAERLLILAIASIIAAITNNIMVIDYGLIIIAIIASITFLHRVIIAINKLS